MCFGPEERVTLSETRVRERLQRIELPPPGYSGREVTAMLLQWAIPDLTIGRQVSPRLETGTGTY